MDSDDEKQQTSSYFETDVAITKATSFTLYLRTTDDGTGHIVLSQVMSDVTSCIHTSSLFGLGAVCLSQTFGPPTNFCFAHLASFGIIQRGV